MFLKIVPVLALNVSASAKVNFATCLVKMVEPAWNSLCLHAGYLGFAPNLFG